MNDIAVRDIVSFLVRWRWWLAGSILLGAVGNVGWSLLAPGGYWQLARVDAVIAVSLPDSVPQRGDAVRPEPFMERTHVVALVGSRRLAAAIVDLPWYADAMDVRALGRDARLEQLMRERRSLREDRSTGLVHLEIRAPTSAAAVRIGRAHVDVANALIAADAVRNRRMLFASLQGVQAHARVAVEWNAMTDAAVAQTTEFLRWGDVRPVVLALDAVPEPAEAMDRARTGALVGASGALAGLLSFLVLACAARRVG